MTKHYLQLASEPFDSIRDGRKVIESRLFDTKRQRIQLNDRLIFTNREAPNQTLEAKVIGLLRYPTFESLFSDNDPRKFGGPSVEWLIKQISEFYSLDDQTQHGVIGIEFELI